MVASCQNHMAELHQHPDSHLPLRNCSKFQITNRQFLNLDGLLSRQVQLRKDKNLFKLTELVLDIVVVLLT